MNSSTIYYLVADLNGEQFLIDTFADAESGQMMMKKVFEMAMPPQVFAINELIRIFEFLNCQRVVGDILENCSDLETNGIISVCVIEESKMKNLKVI